MKLFLKNKNATVNAIGERNSEKEFVVKKGSVVSNKISSAPTFRGSKTVKKMRELYVKNSVVQEDVKFKSPSTAANFVTGSSTDGMQAWKDETGKKLKELI